MRILSMRSWKSKQALVLVAVLSMVLLLGLTGCSSGGSSEQTGQEPVELKLAHFFPSTHPVETDLIQPWAKAIEEATEGQVKITSYSGETLLKAAETYGGVINGVADIGLSCFAYDSGRFPVMGAFELPGITYSNSKVASKVAWEGIKQLNPKEVQDTHLMMVFTTGPGDLFTKTPVRSLEDLKGLEIRATGISAKTLEALGATPVAMPQSDAYEALSKGVVQGNLSPVEVLKGWRHAEVTGYLTRTPFIYNTLFYITMNKDKWEALPEDIREKINKVNEQYFEEVAMGLWDQQNEVAWKWAVEETGMEEIILPDEEVERWKALIKPIQDDYITKLNEKGLDGEEILDTIKNLAKRYNEELK